MNSPQSTLIRSLACSVLLLGGIATARAHEAASEMAACAKHFLAALTSEQRAKAQFEWKAEERVNWHFIPRERKGLPWKEMSPAQRHLGQALLGAALSQRGYVKAATIMSLEEILREMEQANPRMVRDAELYYISIFGTPELKGTWGWRFEGHHLSFNFTIADGHVAASTPSFLGSNPAEVRQGPRRGLKVLAAEEDLARNLLKLLSPGQLRAVIYTNIAPADVITGADRRAKRLAPDGLSAAKMNSAQRAALMRVVAEYVERNRSEVAAEDLRKIEKAGIKNIAFAWAGSTEPGKAHYYRVQGPTFLLEYDNTQNDANHVHAVWRDFANDFGDDALKRHYDQHHSH